MGRNDPDNLNINRREVATLVCDFCGHVFGRDPREARLDMARNQDGCVFCTRSCASRAANAKRWPASETTRSHAGHVCLIRPDAEVCPLVSMPPLQSDNDRRGTFVPQTATEADLCVEYVRAAVTLKQTAPPEDEAAEVWTTKNRIAWERADEAHSLASRLLSREVSRRTR